MLALVLETRGVNKKVEKSYYFLEEIESLHKVSISDLYQLGRQLESGAGGEHRGQGSSWRHRVLQLWRGTDGERHRLRLGL